MGLPLIVKSRVMYGFQSGEGLCSFELHCLGMLRVDAMLKDNKLYGGELKLSADSQHLLSPT